MPEVFKCPSCAAPLEFEGNTFQKCRFCGSSIIVPSDSFQKSDKNMFDDASSLGNKAVKLAEIYREIQAGRKINAIKIFRETFGTGLKEAKDAVDAMERGESVDISGMKVQTANVQTNAQNLKAVKKIGFAIGGSILATIVLTTLIIVGAVVVIFYFTFSAVTRTIEKPFTTQPTTKSEKPQLVSEILRFGGEGIGAGKFKDNRHVAVDGNGRIYSTDYSGGKIQVFDEGGKYLTQWIADANMNLCDMKVNREGKLYLLESRRLSVFEGASGKLRQKVENLSAKGLALTLDGKIVTTNSNGITILDGDLKTLEDFKDAAKNANATFGFEYVAVDGNGLIYALDDQNGDVCKFSPDGRFLNRFTSNSTSPDGIAIDGKGRIFVSDVSNINVFDTSGKLLDSIETKQAFGMTFNDADELFVASRPFVVKYKLNF